METRGMVLAAGAILLGVVTAIFGAYAFQWQPVPKEWPAGNIGPYISAAILILGGAALLWGRSAKWGARVLAGFYGLWVIALHGPLVAAQPSSVVVWLGFFEILAMASGALMLSAVATGDKRLKLIARILFGICPLVFGLSHFVYAQFTADMVPTWIPGGGLFWAYATGAGHVAAGLAILSGVMARLAAGLLTVMFASFVITLHAPRVAADTSIHIEWVMLAVALTICGAAYVMWRTLGRATD